MEIYPAAIDDSVFGQRSFYVCLQFHQQRQRAQVGLGEAQPALALQRRDVAVLVVERYVEAYQAGRQVLCRRRFGIGFVLVALLFDVDEDCVEVRAEDFDVALLAMNPTGYGNYAKVALPAARKKNTGVIAMKVMRNIVGVEATAKELFEYAWTQEGVASAIVGHFGIEPLQENIKLAQEYGKNELASIDRKELESRLAKLAGPHALCWARPGYIDGGIIV